MAEALLDDLEVGPPARSQEACAWRRSWIRTWPIRSADFTARYQMVLRNQFAGMCPSVSRARTPRGLSLPSARRAAR